MVGAMDRDETSDRRGKRRVIDFDVEIGRRLRVQRVQRALSQTELADAVDVSFQQIQKYENGQNRISAGKLILIARALEVPISVFFDGLEDEADMDAARIANAAYREIQAFSATAEGRRLYRAFAQIEKPETRRLILRMLESLATEDELKSQP
jgi:transcriptional regulator with XRE-family HTH domain